MTRWFIPQPAGFEQPSQVIDAFAEKLREHKLELYPTGSRFMGGWKPESDWDYVMLDSPEARKLLEEIGFVDTFGADYVGDEYTSGHMTCTETEPYKHGQLEAIRETKIQVQLTPRVDILLGARDVIARYIYTEHLIAEPERRHELWDMVMKVLDWRAEPTPEPEPEPEPDTEQLVKEMFESYPFAPENF